MSLLTQQTNANTTETYFLKVNAKIANISTINANTISTNVLTAEAISTNMLSAYEGVFSTFSTTQIDLDGQLLTADANDLLLNGVPVATLSSLSSIGDWALEPAISTVQMAGNNILGASTISCQTIVANEGIIASNLTVGNGIFNNLVAFNSLFVSSNTSTISSLILNADLGVMSTISCGTIIGSVGNFSSLTTDSVLVSTISTDALTVSSLTTSTLNAGQISTSQITTGSLFTDSLLVSSLTASTLNAGQISTGVIDAGDLLYMNAERVSTVIDAGVGISNASFRVDAVNGAQGEISLSARPGSAGIGGVVNLLAEGGVSPLGLAYGGEVNITATTGSFTSLALTSAVNLNAAGVNSYAGAITPVASVAGYNFIHGDIGVNLTAGAPSFIPNDPLTLYLYGTNGTLMFGTQYIQGPIRPYSDLTTAVADLYIEAYTSAFNRGYIQLRGVSTQTFEGPSLIDGLNRLNFSTGGQIDNLSTINGLPVGNFENISSFINLTASTITTSSLTIGTVPIIPVFGSFYSSTSQTVVAANTETPLTYTSQTVNVGGLTFAGSTITVPDAGTYEINHSLQFNTTSGGTNKVFFWFKKNGADIPQTTSYITVANNAEDLGTISIFDTAAAGDQYACCFASPDANMTANALPISTIFPAVPSIITNIKRLG